MHQLLDTVNCEYSIFWTIIFMYNYLIHRLFLSKPLLHVLSGHIYTFSINTLAYKNYYALLHRSHKLLQLFLCIYVFALINIRVCVCACSHSCVCVLVCPKWAMTHEVCVCMYIHYFSSTSCHLHTRTTVPCSTAHED